MPAATRFTRVTGDCLRVLLRVVLRVLLRVVLRVFLAVVPADLRVELFLRAGPRFAAVLVAPRLLAALRPPVLRAPAFLVLLPAALRVALRVDLRAPPLRVDAFRATVLRVPFFAFDFDPRFAPVREPEVRLELLRDDFLVAMLYSGTLVNSAHVNPSKNRAQMYNAQEFFAQLA
jgi:hypothetical protein